MEATVEELEREGPMFYPTADAPGWAQALASFDNSLDRVVQISFVALTALFAAVMLAGVFFRYVLNNSLAWSDELALIIFIWAMFLSIASGYLHDRHVNLDIIIKSLSPTWSARVAVLSEGIAAGYLIALIVSSYQALELTGRAHTDALGLPQTLPFAAIPVAATIMLFHWARRNSWRGLTPSIFAKLAISLFFFWMVVVPFGHYIHLAGATRSILLVVMLFGPMLIGVPVAICLGLGTTVFLGADGNVPFETGAMQMFFGVSNLTLVAIPLLIVSGKLLHSAGIAKLIVDFAQVLVGKVRGGLGAANVISSFIFGDISGSAVADTAAIGSVMIPQMKARGYHADFCAALQGAAGTLGMMAPLSITVLLYSTAVNSSVSRLAAATIVPAFLVAGSFMLVALHHARKWNYPAESVPRSEFLPRTLKAFPGIFALVVVVAGILGGVISPAEIGSVLVTYVLLLSVFLYRTAKRSVLFRAVVEAGYVSGMTIFIVATSCLLGFALSRDMVGTEIVNFVAQISTNKYMIIFLVSAVFILLGMVLEAPAMIFGFLPSFMPLLTQAGVDVIHWGVLFAVNMGLGCIIPPVALNLFVSTRLAGTTYGEALRASVPFITIMFVDMVLLVVFPQMALLLPHILYS